MSRKEKPKITRHLILLFLLIAGLLVLNRPLTAKADPVDKSGGLVFEWLNEVPKEKTVYTAGGGQITWIPVLEGNTVVSGTVLLQNAVVNNSAGMGINFPVPIQIQAEGNNQITSKSTGIYLSDRATGNPLDLDITGSGSLKINSGGDGIQTAGNITASAVRLEVYYGTPNTTGNQGIYSTRGSIILKDSNYIKIKNTAGIGYNSGAIALQNANTIRIENCHAIIINEAGAAISSAGKIELISSDVRAIGKTDNGGASGTLSYNQLEMDGGTLYGENRGSDLEIPKFPVSAHRVSIKNSGVIYGYNANLVLPIEGDSVWYYGCSYQENTDAVTVPAGGFTFGDIVWNDHMILGEGKTLSIGRYSTKTSSLTIPEGTTVDMPTGSKININGSTKDSQLTSSLNVNGTLNIGEGAEVWNKQNATFLNNGTVNIQDKGGIYNAYDKSTQTGGLFQNKGELNVSPSGVFQNQNRLENSGTINTTGNFSTILLTDYDAVIDNTGKINGFVIDMYDDKYINVAHGKTVVKNGQTLTLGAGVSNGKSRGLKVLNGAELMIEEGAVVDAKAHVTSDTLGNYIDLGDTITVNGELLLPDQTPEELLNNLAEHITGNGQVSTGGAAKYIVTINTGTTSETQLIEDNGTVSLPQPPSRYGYKFDGWYVKDGDTFKPFDAQTAIKNSMKIISKWTAVNTGTTSPSSPSINAWTTPLSIKDWTYGETPSGPKAVPKYGADTIHYTYSSHADGPYTDAVPQNAGIWYVKAAVQGTYGYTGLESSAISFKIKPAEYKEDGSIIISEIKNEEDLKNLVIKDGELELEKDTDYTLTTSTNGNKATVTITFQGNYTGTVIRTYTATTEKPDEPETLKADITKNTVSLNQKAKAVPYGTKLKVTWGKVSQAAGYYIYGEKCGQKMRLIKSLTGNHKTSLSISKIGKKKISTKAGYKIQIWAYRMVNGKREIIAKSLTLHTAGKNQKNFTNAKSIKVSGTKVSLKKGKEKKIKATTVKEKFWKKLFPQKHVATYRYYSTDKSIASISKTGKIKAQKKGSCTIYIVAPNGVKKGIKVTVK